MTVAFRDKARPLGGGTFQTAHNHLRRDFYDLSVVEQFEPKLRPLLEWWHLLKSDDALPLGRALPVEALARAGVDFERSYVVTADIDDPMGFRFSFMGHALPQGWGMDHRCVSELPNEALRQTLSQDLLDVVSTARPSFALIAHQAPGMDRLYVRLLLPLDDFGLGRPTTVLAGITHYHDPTGLALAAAGSGTATDWTPSASAKHRIAMDRIEHVPTDWCGFLSFRMKRAMRIMETAQELRREAATRSPAEARAMLNEAAALERQACEN